jgi:hypothetical protein
VRVEGYGDELHVLNVDVLAQGAEDAHVHVLCDGRRLNVVVLREVNKGSDREKVHLVVVTVHVQGAI